jgi:hypothetical protein
MREGFTVERGAGILLLLVVVSFAYSVVVMRTLYFWGVVWAGLFSAGLAGLLVYLLYSFVLVDTFGLLDVISNRLF